MDVFYWHNISQFWAIKGGLNYVYRPGDQPYIQPGIGIEGLMPYFIETDAKVYFHKKSLKIDLSLSRATQIGDNFFIETGIRGVAATKTVEKDMIGHGVNKLTFTIKPYIFLKPGLSLFIQEESTQFYGALKKLRRVKSESAQTASVSLGLSVLF